MNTSPPPPPSEPQLPARRPYGSTTLPVAVAAVPPRPARVAATAPEGWHSARVRLPLLSIESLRYDRPRG
ncbi:hypothetical protein [Streptomyces sp.]|uniref:hypothetical protein n=1 Tax=Streptomyces sp. TaxID=1931 RepID=UPI002F3E2A2E